jgi:hypothetical protein
MLSLCDFYENHIDGNNYVKTLEVKEFLADRKRKIDFGIFKLEIIPITTATNEKYFQGSVKFFIPVGSHIRKEWGVGKKIEINHGALDRDPYDIPEMPGLYVHVNKDGKLPLRDNDSGISVYYTVNNPAVSNQKILDGLFVIEDFISPPLFLTALYASHKDACDSLGLFLYSLHTELSDKENIADVFSIGAVENRAILTVKRQADQLISSKETEKHSFMFHKHCCGRHSAGTATNRAENDLYNSVQRQLKLWASCQDLFISNNTELNFSIEEFEQIADF